MTDDILDSFEKLTRTILGEIEIVIPCEACGVKQRGKVADSSRKDRFVTWTCTMCGREQKSRVPGT